jgi:FkbM family methyltransferase
MDDSGNLALIETNGCHLLCYADEKFAMRLPAYSGDVTALLRRLGLGPMPVKVASHTHVPLFASIVEAFAAGATTWRLIDIGGYIGAIGIPVAKWAAQRQSQQLAHIDILEPTPMSSLLCQSVALNQLDALVRIQRCAASNSNGRSIFNSDAHQRVAGRLGGARTDSSLTVDTLTIDHLFPSIHDELVLAKIDTEGHEPKVLEGMLNVLAHNCVVAIVEFHEFCIGHTVGSQRYEDFLFERFRVFNVGNIGYPKALQEVASGDVSLLRALTNRDGNKLTDLVCFDRRLPSFDVDRIVAPFAP